MKSAQSLLGAVVVVGALAALAARAQAGTYQCKVRKASPSGATQVRIVLTDTVAAPAFTDKVFRAPTGREKEMLAVALSAIQSGLKVEVVATPSTGIPQISSLYLLQ